MYETYRELIHLRRQYPALRRGDFTPLIRDDAKGVYAFQRTIADERVLVVINNGEYEQRVRLPVHGTWKHLWKTGTVVCTDSDEFTVLMDQKTGLVLVNSAEDDSSRPRPRGSLK
jgi:maltooligosyltrehalose synthase